MSPFRSAILPLFSLIFFSDISKNAPETLCMYYPVPQTMLSQIPTGQPQEVGISKSNGISKKFKLTSTGNLEAEILCEVPDKAKQNISYIKQKPQSLTNFTKGLQNRTTAP